MLSAIIFVLRPGLPWRYLPECYGPWSTVHARYRRWCATGLFARMLAVLAKGAEGKLRHLDCSHIKLHQHGSNPQGGQAAQGMVRTKGGLTTKPSAVVDARGRAVALTLAPGPPHDQHGVVPVLPSVRGCRVVAVKYFDADVFRSRLRPQRSRCCIPPKRCRCQPGRFHLGYYRCRHLIDNFFGRIKIHRRISIRYEKLAESFRGFVFLAAILDWFTH